MKDLNVIKNKLKFRRTHRTRSKIYGTAERPRVAVFRSLKHLSVQAINDESSITIASVYDREIRTKDKKNLAKEIGLLLAKKMLEKKVSQSVFDKRHYKYHGLIKDVADGIREGGIRL